ncbi:MAG: hypothetical protein IE934_08885 [Sphingopyxis sp.]|nr:hypothetical protein [Sphingopyxis sp.]
MTTPTPRPDSVMQGCTSGQRYPKLLERPENCPGAYVMHFYCKYENPEHPWQMGGHYMEEPVEVETRGAAIAQMRRAGWIYHRDGTATCPKCSAAISRARGES